MFITLFYEISIFLQERETSTDDGLDTNDAEILDEFTTRRGELKLRTRSLKDDRLLQARFSPPDTC